VTVVTLRQGAGGGMVSAARARRGGAGRALHRGHVAAGSTSASEALSNTEPSAEGLSAPQLLRVVGGLCGRSSINVDSTRAPLNLTGGGVVEVFAVLAVL